MPPAAGCAGGSTDRLERVADLPAGEPVGPSAVELLDARADEARHVPLDVVSDLGLRVGEVLVANGEARQQVGVELERGRGVDRIKAVLLVDRLAQHDPPRTLALLHEVVEAADAGDVAFDTVDC